MTHRSSVIRVSVKPDAVGTVAVESDWSHAAGDYVDRTDHRAADFL